MKQMYVIKAYMDILEKDLKRKIIKAGLIRPNATISNETKKCYKLTFELIWLYFLHSLEKDLKKKNIKAELIRSDGSVSNETK